MDYRQAQDAQLMEALARGETRALGELVRRYQDGALSLAHRTLAQTDGAQDVVQEAYLRVYRAAGSLPPHSQVLHLVVPHRGEPVLRPPSQFQATGRAAGRADTRGPVGGA